MSLRRLARDAALRIPPLRRLYEHARQLGAERDALIQERARLEAAAGAAAQERDALAASLQETRAELGAAQRELRTVSEERERLEVALYVRTSEFQRAVDFNDALRRELSEGADQGTRAPS